MDENRTKNYLFNIFILLVIAVIISIIYLVPKISTAIWYFLILIVIIYLLFKFKIILTLKDYERAVVFRYGKVHRVGGPGWFFLIPGLEKPHIVTLRVETIDIPPQRVLTKDNIELIIDGVLFISVKPDKQSVINSLVKVEDYKKASTAYIIAVLRDVVGQFNLSEVIKNIELINDKLKKSLIGISEGWGVKINSVEISDVKIPDEILNSMHAQKAAVQKKLAVYEFAESEKAKILAVKDATDQLSDKTVVYYYIKALEKMAEGQSSKIIFPMEVTNLLDSVSSNLLRSKKITPENIQKGINENDLSKYLPLIQNFVKNSSVEPKPSKSKKVQAKTTKKKTKKTKAKTKKVKKKN